MQKCTRRHSSDGERENTISRTELSLSLSPVTTHSPSQFVVACSLVRPFQRCCIFRNFNEFISKLSMDGITSTSSNH